MIDLNKTNAETLRTALRPLVAAALTEKTSSRRVRSRRRGNAKVRDWARENGIMVAARGSISARVLERYDAAHLRALVFRIVGVAPGARSRVRAYGWGESRHLRTGTGSFCFPHVTP